MNEMAWLQEWFKSQCNGEWEHSYGIHIATLDNPGWEVRVDIAQAMDVSEIELLSSEKSDDDWIHCKVANGIFSGYGDAKKLSDILQVLRNFVELSAGRK
jgi:hypothetical protein